MCLIGDLLISAPLGGSPNADSLLVICWYCRNPRKGSKCKQVASQPTVRRPPHDSHFTLSSSSMAWRLGWYRTGRRNRDHHRRSDAAHLTPRCAGGRQAWWPPTCRHYLAAGQTDEVATMEERSRPCPEALGVKLPDAPPGSIGVRSSSLPPRFRQMAGHAHAHACTPLWVRCQLYGQGRGGQEPSAVVRHAGIFGRGRRHGRRPGYAGRPSAVWATRLNPLRQ